MENILGINSSARSLFRDFYNICADNGERDVRDGDIRDGDFPLAGLSIVSNKEDEIKRTKFKEKRKKIKILIDTLF